MDRGIDVEIEIEKIARDRCGDRDRINRRIEIESVGDRHDDRGKIDRGIDMVIEGYKGDRRVSCSPGMHQVCTRCAPG